MNLNGLRGKLSLVVALMLVFPNTQAATCDFDSFEKSVHVQELAPLRTQADLGWIGTYGSDLLVNEFVHIPQERFMEFVTKYNDNLKTKVHEARHIVNNRVNNWFDKMGIYLGKNKSITFEGMNLHKSTLQYFIPKNLQGSRFELYVYPGASGMRTDVSYMLDEFMAYLIENEMHLEFIDKNLWVSEPQYVESLEGIIDFTLILSATYRAVKYYNPSYSTTQPFFDDAMFYFMRRAMKLIRTVEKTPAYSKLMRPEEHALMARIKADPATQKTFNIMLGPDCQELHL